MGELLEIMSDRAVVGSPDRDRMGVTMTVDAPSAEAAILEAWWDFRKALIKVGIPTDFRLMRVQAVTAEDLNREVGLSSE